MVTSLHTFVNPPITLPPPEHRWTQVTAHSGTLTFTCDFNSWRWYVRLCSLITSLFLRQRRWDIINLEAQSSARFHQPGTPNTVPPLTFASLSHCRTRTRQLADGYRHRSLTLSPLHGFFLFYVEENSWYVLESLSQHYYFSSSFPFSQKRRILKRSYFSSS